MDNYDYDKIREQISRIRNEGTFTMFDISTVMRYADMFNYDELIALIEKDEKSYMYFILTGKFE
ncbi:MAG: DUF5049 domain-containing protein [Oscillospiraceae bacterium]|jgi:hypothetical protein|nr:DUF5049 domain-containing protein [Oscillospiraceae bacterium]